MFKVSRTPAFAGATLKCYPVLNHAVKLKHLRQASEEGATARPEERAATGGRLRCMAGAGCSMAPMAEAFSRFPASSVRRNFPHSGRCDEHRLERHGPMFLSPQQYFRRQDARPRKRFGQHFLSRAETAERIVLCAELQPDDPAVEIGPGLGALTGFILERAESVHLVEIDNVLADYLEARIQASGYRVRVHRRDVMRFDFASLSRAEGRPLVVLGNLPYNISSPLVFHLLESRKWIARGVFMVQKEVGTRLASGPGVRDYGVLSVLLGIYARVTPLFDVGPGQFYPPPKVDSMVLRIDFDNDSAPEVPSFASVRRVVNAAFQQRRKTLRNSLGALMGKHSETLEKAFETSGVDPNRRPETLSPAEFLLLAQTLEELREDR